MSDSRRSFLGGAAMFLASTACLKGLEAVTVQGNTKKGLAGAAPSNSQLHTSWYYNWSIKPSSKGMPVLDQTMRFLPMVWGWNPEKTPAVLESMRAQHPEIILGFNEPDHQDQSNIPVKTALEAWPLFDGVAAELVSPAAANPLGPWMREFMHDAEKRKLRVDSIAVHNYPAPSPVPFVDMLHRVHDLYRRPIWVTEFAVADWQAKNGGANRFSVSQVADFMEAVCTEMNRIPWIKGYAWFPVAGKASNALQTSVLFNADGNLTALGKLYAGL